MGKKFNIKKAEKSLKNKTGKKKPNKNHKQKYFKAENKKIDKSGLYEIEGNREELAEYVGQIFKVKCFITNTYKYSEGKRLFNSVILPIKKDGKRLYVKHLWTKSENTKHLNHGYKWIEVQIIEYPDLYNNKKKYGIKFLKLSEKPKKRLKD